MLYATLLTAIRLHRAVYIAAAAAAVALIVILVVILRPGKGRRVSKPVPGNRVHPGDPCPCGHGTVRVTRGQFGEFLGCTDFRYDRSGCNRAWAMDGQPFG